MNKQERQELSKRLTCLEASCKNLGTEIQIIKSQLAEAEKPKLRHGDFGISRGGSSRLFLDTWSGKKQYAGDKHLWDELTEKSTSGTLDAQGDIIFGNIFDLLMKDWGEDFNGYEAVVMDSADGGDKVLIEHSTRSKDKIFIGSCLRGQRQLGIHLSESELQGFWKAIGHALMELKRKQSKT